MNNTIQQRVKSILFFAALLISCTTSAQDNFKNNFIDKLKNKGVELELKAGINIGGAAPIPIPRSIRIIDYYSPHLNATLEGSATKWLDNKHKWGISTGIKIEEKSMSTAATTKGYKTNIINSGTRINGYWTGKVQTDYRATMITIPITVNYSINKLWKISMGLFTSVRLEGKFNGYVSEGYLRENSPIGEKLSFNSEQKAAYDFGKELRRFNWGIQIGSSLKVYKRLSLNTDFNWGVNNIFKDKFKTINFKMYNIFMNIGFGYTL